MTNLQQYLQDREEEFKKCFEYKDVKNEVGFNVIRDRKDGFPASDEQIIEFNNQTLQTALRMQAEMIEKEILRFQRGTEYNSFDELYDEALSIIENYK